jgi:hypothetical protein
MILINLLKEKTIIYDVETVELIKNANFVITLDSNKVYNYGGIISKTNKTITVSLPSLQNIAKDGESGTCYLEIQDINNRFYKIENDTIEFKSIPVITLQFSEDPQPKVSKRNVDEIFLTGDRITTEKRSGPPPRNIARNS